MPVKNIVAAIKLTNIASSTLTGAYQAINTGLSSPCFLIRIINNSSTDVTVSYDGINDNDYIPHGTFVDLNFATNSQPNNNCALMPINTIVYVKGTAGTGNIYLAGYYQPASPF